MLICGVNGYISPGQVDRHGTAQCSSFIVVADFITSSETERGGACTDICENKGACSRKGLLLSSCRLSTKYTNI
jgi:hypothetical protein